MPDDTLKAQNNIVEGLATALLVCLLVPFAFFNGWIVWLLWGWFVAPIGAAPLGYMHAVGVSVCVNFLAFYVVKPDPTKTAMETIGDAYKAVISRSMFVGLAGIIHLIIR